MDADITWAAWTDDAILIHRSQPGTGAGVQRLPHRTPAGLRYFVRLFRRAGVLSPEDMHGVEKAVKTQLAIL